MTKLVFALHDEVKLPELIHKDLIGRVLSIYIGEEGTQYKVRYFWEAKPLEVYFYEWELRRVENDKS